MTRPVAVAASLLLAATAVLGSGGLLVAPASAATSAGTVTVSLTAQDSGDLGAGAPLRTFVQIDNPTATDTAAGMAKLSVNPIPFSSRSALANWFSGKTSASAASKVVASTSVPSVHTQLSDTVGIDAAASSLPFTTAGVYGVSVRITAGSTVLGTARTAVAWNAAASAAVPVTIAVPLTVPAGESEFLSATQLTQYTAVGGILTIELADIQNSHVAVGIDPRILASIRVLGKSAPETATAWLNELAALPNETFPLAWADADLTVPLHAGADAVLQPHSLAYAIDPDLFPVTTESTATPAPGEDQVTPGVPTSDWLVHWNYTMPALEWPTDSSVEPADLSKLNAAGITSAIVTSANVAKPAAAGLAGAAGKSGATTLAVTDDVLSGYFRESAQAPTRQASVNPLTELTTTLALIGLESGSKPKTVLLTVDRNWASTEPNFTRTVNSLFARSWTTSTLLSSVFEQSPSDVTLNKDAEPEQRIDLVSEMLYAETRLARFAPVAVDPAAITSSYRIQLLSMLSNEWLDTPNAWLTAAKAYVTQVNTVVSSVQVSRSSTYLGLADQLPVPISISNGLDQDVTVRLSVRPRSTRVVIDEKYQTQTITIPANSQRRVQIPIEAISNGNAQLVVTLASSTGVTIGSPVILKVNVQAGWQTVGTAIFVALIVALFAFGIVLTIRKRRKAAAGEADGDEPEAAHE